MRISKAMATKVIWVLVLSLMLVGEANDGIDAHSHFLAPTLGIITIVAAVTWALWALYISRSTRADLFIKRTFTFLLPIFLLVAAMNISFWSWIGISLTTFLIWALLVSNEAFLTWAKNLEADTEPEAAEG
ncbi:MULTISPECIES: hypothetical protein [unclassified Corynebacterium]|uniref:hypothetical protein n=1 Tax=unclassified Corynebacterium TaxID=2624378 RepID=UPI0029CA4E90|nr:MULTISPECIES: hypothetical protein [unclassified Corynebacterium]WPF66840.1 hypothetical protein OLX12_03710 [Corynebacterium sp. 22KM0430]WPF69328.1 hypothetical protein OLW90_03705 [Corynebacterium sp. 21KM1197]